MRGSKKNNRELAQCFGKALPSVRYKNTFSAAKKAPLVILKKVMQKTFQGEAKIILLMFLKMCEVFILKVIFVE